MNILLTSVGRRSYLVEYFKAALNGSGKVYVSNSTDHTPAFAYADGYTVTPLIYDESYIPFLMDYCKKNDISILLSLLDIDLAILAGHKVEFAEIGVKIIVSDENVIEICNDKWKTFNFLKENGFDTPETFLKADDCLKAINNSEIKYPIIVKPRWGLGSIGIFEADNEDELRIFHAKALKTIQKTYLKYESACDLENSVLFQQKIDGYEIGIDIFNDLNADFVNAVIKNKFAMRAGETDGAETIYDEKIYKIAEKLSRELKHISNMDCDVLMGDKPYILELNARFGGGYPFSHIAGANLPLAIVRWCRGENTDKELLTAKIGIKAYKDIILTKQS